MLHQLRKPVGSTKNRKRVGRGPGSTLGKTSGRGHKGQKSRSGSKQTIGFEGGQMPLHRRLPKKGFTNIFKTEFQIVTIRDLINSKKLDTTQTIDKQALKDAGIIKSTKKLVKLLNKGTTPLKSTIIVDAASESVCKNVAAAGGEVQLIVSHPKD